MAFSWGFEGRLGVCLLEKQVRASLAAGTVEGEPQRSGSEGHVAGNTRIEGSAPGQKDLGQVTSPLCASVLMSKMRRKTSPSQGDNGRGKGQANANVPYLIFHALFGGQGYFCPR